jgi:3-oxoacyl-[acyl-carrier protein] reductase
MDLELENKCGLVTGGTRGLGAAIVEAFLDGGSRVVTNYRSNDLAAEKFLRDLGDKLRRNVVVFKNDLA